MNRLPAFVIGLILSSLIIFSAPSLSGAAGEPPRSCIVKEVLKGGMYVYIRCQEKDKEIWLATVAMEFKTDQVISFADAPPMIDFYSKFLNRTFPEVILTDILPPEAKKK
ncbi:MAG TPA: hypothetical protein VN652_03385 [Geobacteraceae bacterium]|nr:hypothetical protein [Geobacteraceae bacterium]